MGDTHFYEPKDGHRLPHDPFKAIVAPRPIGWISTVDAEGRPNLAPYSFFNAFCARRSSFPNSVWERIPGNSVS
jgi:flavin reductase (DIM6/NTAB) family NADH-FMN oxidoreductase RutF